MRGLLIPLLFFVILILTVLIGASASSEPDPDSENLPLSLTTKHETEIVSAGDGMPYIAAALNGTLYLTESGSQKVLWSFSSGPSIYSFYTNQEGEKLNAFNSYMDFGEDWELYSPETDLMKANKSIEEVVQSTPKLYRGGGIMLGSKKTCVFVLDAETGKLIQTIGSDNLPSVECGGVVDEASIVTRRGDIQKWQAANIYVIVTRTDYTLKYTYAKTGKVLWSLAFADIQATFNYEPFLDGILPIPVFRLRNHNSSVGPLLIERKAQEILYLPPSDHKELIKELPPVSKRLALQTNELEASTNRSVSSNVESDSMPQSNLWPNIIYSALLPMAMTFFYCVKRAIGTKRGAFQQQHEDSKPKKRKGRKQAVNGKKHETYTHAGVVVEAIKEDSFLTPNPFDSNGTSIYGRKIGRLVVTNKEIAKGSNGTVVLEGNYEGRLVAVKRLVRTHNDVAVKEIQNLIASDQHPNIVRWHGVEYDQDFVYLCLERCTCSLFDLITLCTSSGQVTTTHQLLVNLGSMEELQLWKANGFPSPLLLKLMRDTVRGLAHLHELGIIHRDLKPQNVLVIKDRYISAKISDMGISKHLDKDMSSLTKHATGSGSSGWQAPEQLRNDRQTRAVDLFSLGCMLFFCLTGGKHPYGENIERDVNIINARKDLFLIDHNPEATDLISQLLDPNPNMRPKAVEAMHHPIFWNSETRLSFLRDVSDRIELEDREKASELLEALENTGTASLGGKWDEKMETAFINDIGRFRRYRYDSVRDLLRVIRNKLNHYRELSEEVQTILGSLPEGFNSYFSTRFPNLLIQVYNVIRSHCFEEEQFRKYFTSSGF